MKSIKRGAALLRPMEFISVYSTNAPGRASTGLIVCGYQFSDRQPGDLAELFTRAIAELKAATAEWPQTNPRRPGAAAAFR